MGARLIWFSLLVLMVFLLAGCGGKGYKVSREEYRLRVQTLGVLPLMVDEQSTISHPQRREIIELLRRHNASRHERLVEMIREEKSYFDVRVVSGDPRMLFDRLVAGRVMRGKGAELHRSYEFDSQNARLLAGNNVVDALLVVVMNGVTRPEKRRDRALLSYLEAEYNSVLVSAAVIVPSGAVIWEYPAGKSFLDLQYPDFDEAHYNKADAVKIKNISLDGLNRALAESGGGVFNRSAYPGAYQGLFAEIAGALDTGLLNPLKP